MSVLPSIDEIWGAVNRSGWLVGDTASASTLHVNAYNGENVIHADATTRAEARSNT